MDKNKMENPSDSEQDEDRLQRLEKKINKLLKGFESMKDINKNMQVLHKSQEHFNSVFEDFKSKFEDTLKEVQTLKQTIDKVQSENQALKKENREIRMAMDDCYYNSRKMEMEIVGIPAKNGENPKQIVIDIGRKVGCPNLEKELVSAKRPELAKNKTGAILVRFTGGDVCSKFIQEGKKRRLKAKDLGFSGSDAMIFFNECLSPTARELLYKARQRKNALGYKFLWVKNGRIFLREKENERIFKIVCEADLDVLGNKK